MLEALILCKREGKQLLNLELKSDTEATKIFSLVSEWITTNGMKYHLIPISRKHYDKLTLLWTAELNEKITAVWVGNNDLFSPIGFIQWEWGDQTKEKGHCLSVGVLRNNRKVFTLHREPCKHFFSYLTLNRWSSYNVVRNFARWITTMGYMLWWGGNWGWWKYFPRESIK